MSVFVLSVIVCVVFLIWWWWKLPPRTPRVYHGALPIIGHLHQFFQQRKDIWRYFSGIGEFARKGDNYTCLRLGPRFLYAVADPEQASYIANSCLEKSFPYFFTREFIRNGLLISDAETWKLHRKLLNPALNQQLLNTYVDEINVQSRMLVSQLTPLAGQGPVDTRRFITAFMLRLICRTSLGLDVEAQELINANYVKAIDEILNLFTERGFCAWLHPSFIYNWTAMKRKEEKLIEDIKNMMNPVIQKRKSELRERNFLDSDEYLEDRSTKKFKPFLDLLLYFAEKDHVFSDNDIREHLDTFVIASYDTSSMAIQHIMLLLGTHQDVQERVYNEVMEIFQNNEDLDKTDLTKFVYLDAVIKESLRLYPPIPYVTRDIRTDLELREY